MKQAPRDIAGNLSIILLIIFFLGLFSSTLWEVVETHQLSARQTTLLGAVAVGLHNHTTTLVAIAAQEKQIKSLIVDVHQEIINGHRSTLGLLDELTSISKQTKGLVNLLDAEEADGKPVLQEFRSDVLRICVAVRCTAVPISKTIPASKTITGG